MEVEEQVAAQAHTNVGQEREIVTVMPTVLAIWYAVRTTVMLHLDFRLTTTAAVISKYLINMST